MPRLASVLFALAACSCESTDRSDEIAAAAAPEGWFLSGTEAQSFRIAADRQVSHRGAASGRLVAIRHDVTGAATMMQTIPAAPYRGRRVRFSAHVQTERVERWAGLWMRVDRPDGRDAFDNMQDRAVHGTTGWTRREVVLDVADDAAAIQFGLLQDGPGISRIDDAALEIVGGEVAPTDMDRRPRALENPGFEAGSDVPAGWLPSGFDLDGADIALDRDVRHGGAASARMRLRADSPSGRGMMLQSIRAADHRGKRLRVSAWVKGADVESGWLLAQAMAADSGLDSEGISRGTCDVEGTFDWRRCEVVLDVPARAETIHVSACMAGHGTIWIDDVLLEEVDASVPLTWIDRRPREPAGGDFEASGMDGWFLSGGARVHYEAALDPTVAHQGRASARLRPRVDRPLGYGTLMQLFRAEEYRGRRLRLTAFLRGSGIGARGDFWARVQSEESPADGPGLGGGRCALSGTFDWRPCRLVFDVPAQGDSIQLGIGLDGPGAIWIDDVRVEPVGRDVPLERGDGPMGSVENGDLEVGGDEPTGWFMSGGAKDEFTASLDRGERAAGAASARLRPRVTAPGGYGTLMQTIRAADHRGKRLRMTAQVRGRGVVGRGDFWLRVQAPYSPADGPGLGGGACRLSGDFDWKPCEIVFDVPEAGEEIQYGIGLAAPGTVWLDQVRLEEVSRAVPLTGAAPPRTGPLNLDFESVPGA